MNAASNKVPALEQSPLAGLAGPLRIASWVLRGFALLVAAGFIAAAFMSGQFSLVPVVALAIVLLLAEALRFAARRIEGVSSTDLMTALPVLAARGFGGAGLLLVFVGLAMVLGGRSGIWVAVLGVAMIGAAIGARTFVGAYRNIVPEGRRKVLISDVAPDDDAGEAAGGTHGRQQWMVVDADATEDDVEAARQRHIQAGLRQRRDWAAGVIKEDAVHYGGLVRLATLIWCVAVAVLLPLALWQGGFLWWMLAGAAPITVLLLGITLRARLQDVKFGRSELVLESTPAVLGERLRATVRTGIARRDGAPAAFRLTLKCVHGSETQFDSATDEDISSDSTSTRTDELWSAAMDARANPYGRAPVRLAVPVDFELPTDQPVTTVGAAGGNGVSWVLEVHAPVRGLDYRASFQLPVFARGYGPRRGGAARVDRP